MPWTGNGQKAKNVGMTVTCMDCNKSRCLYASKKITEDEKNILTSYLDTICYTCGTTFNNYYEETEGNFFEESSRKWRIEVLDDEDDNVLSDMESEEETEETEVLINENPTQEDTNVSTSRCARDNINQELKNILSKVFVNASLECYNEMEKAYYSAKFPPVCFNCGSTEYVMPVPEKQYPYCEACTTDPHMPIKTGKGLNFSSDNTQSSKRRGKKARKDY